MTGREDHVEKTFRGKKPRATGRAARARAIPTKRRFPKSRQTAGFPHPGNGRRGGFDGRRDASVGAGHIPEVSALIKPSRRFWKLSATSSTVRGASIADGGRFSKQRRVRIRRAKRERGGVRCADDARVEARGVRRACE